MDLGTAPTSGAPDIRAPDIRPPDIRPPDIRPPIPMPLIAEHGRHRSPGPRGLAAVDPRRLVPVTRSAGESVRGWAGRPTGRLIVAGLVIGAMLAFAGVAGAFVMPGSTPRAQATPTPDAAGPSDPAEPSAGEFPPLPTPTVTTPPLPEIGGRPADAYAAWALPIGAKLDIPSVALEAYAYAEVVVAQRKPACKLSWTLLAGIGKVESNHGRFRDSRLNPDGRALPSIVGAPLDGQSGRDTVPDTDGGRYDGDRSWDRAVGPLQFIPATWQQYAIDADSDTVTDPNDIDDAALTAAEFLCAGGRDLSTADGWYGAVQAYNRPADYQQSVFSAANDYGRRSRA